METLYTWIDENEESLLSWKVPVVMSGLYLSGIFMLKKWKERQNETTAVKILKGDKTNNASSTLQHTGSPTKPKTLKDDPVRVCMAAHNLFLFLLSLSMVVMTIYEAFIVRWPQFGGMELFCSNDKAIYNKGLFFWSVVFYFSKYYEYLDTVFIILNNRPLLFLHVWHHLSIAFLTLAFLNHHYTFLFSGVLINSGIHTAMYWSYYQTLIGKDVWWKRYLTQMQMVQFAWGIGSWLPWPFVCGWDPVAVSCIALNLTILSSFFYLFKLFYNTRYESSSKKGSPSSTTTKDKKTKQPGDEDTTSFIQETHKPHSVEEKDK